MFRVITNENPPPPKPTPPDAPCPHGYALAGNCVRCTPPPKYAPINGSRTR
jgi:hypothetical protein